MSTPPSNQSTPAPGPISDDDLRRTMAALMTASTRGPMTPQDFLALVEQKKDEMHLPSPSAVGCVFFDCAGKRWGIRLNDIERIVAATDISSVIVPNSPAWFTGVFHIDIEIASLIDLSLFLDPSFIERRQRDMALLIVKQDDDLFGLLVSRLGHALMLESDELIAVTGQTSLPSPYITSVYLPRNKPEPDAARALGLLDISAIITAITATLTESRHRHV